MSTPSSPPGTPERLVSLDAFRGLTMLFMASSGFGIPQIAKAFPDSAFWELLHYNTTHAAWVGGGAWDMGYVDALYNLGLFYATGQGTQIDEAEAYALWSVAAKTDSGAKSNLEIIRTRLSPAKLQSGRRRTEELEYRIKLNLERAALR